MSLSNPFLPPNPLYPRASGGAGAEGLKKQFLINKVSHIAGELQGSRDLGGSNRVVLFDFLTGIATRESPENRGNENPRSLDHRFAVTHGRINRNAFSHGVTIPSTLHQGKTIDGTFAFDEVTGNSDGKKSGQRNKWQGNRIQIGPPECSGAKAKERRLPTRRGAEGGAWQAPFLVSQEAGAARKVRGDWGERAR